jgi:hypothetical protein
MEFRLRPKPLIRHSANSQPMRSPGSSNSAWPTIALSGERRTTRENRMTGSRKFTSPPELERQSRRSGLHRRNFVVFEPTEEKMPPPLKADLVWAWPLLAALVVLILNAARRSY